MTDHTIPMQTQPESALKSGRHPVNVGHLVMGIAFLGIALAWALIVSDAVEGNDIRWLLPMPWVAAGVAGVVASLLPSRRRRHETRQQGWVDAPADPAGTSEADSTTDDDITTDATTDTTTDTTTDETPEETR
jgi:hypothetical protein